MPRDLAATIRVTLCVDLYAAMALERGPWRPAVLFQQPGVGLPVLAQQPGRALDVSEEEGDGAGRQRAHVLIMPARSQRSTPFAP